MKICLDEGKANIIELDVEYKKSTISYQKQLLDSSQPIRLLQAMTIRSQTEQLALNSFYFLCLAVPGGRALNKAQNVA